MLACLDLTCSYRCMRLQYQYLANMYYHFGMQLQELSAEQCTSFAAEADSLLVGVDSNGAPSTSVCIENAQNVRTH